MLVFRTDGCLSISKPRTIYDFLSVLITISHAQDFFSSTYALLLFSPFPMLLFSSTYESSAIGAWGRGCTAAASVWGRRVLRRRRCLREGCAAADGAWGSRAGRERAVAAAWGVRGGGGGSEGADVGWLCEGGLGLGCLGQLGRLGCFPWAKLDVGHEDVGLLCVQFGVFSYFG